MQNLGNTPITTGQRKKKVKKNILENRNVSPPLPKKSSPSGFRDVPPPIPGRRDGKSTSHEPPGVPPPPPDHDDVAIYINEATTENRQKSKQEENGGQHHEEKEAKTPKEKIQHLLFVLSTPLAFIFTILRGVARVLIFTSAFMPCVELSLTWMEEVDLPDLENAQRSYRSMMGVWNYLTTFMEVLACIVVMVDSKLSTDAPFGSVVSEFTFMYLFKIPPNITRALLWLVVAAIPIPPVLQQTTNSTLGSEMALLSFVLTLVRKFCIFPAVVLLIIDFIKYRRRLVKINVDYRKQPSNTNHWSMTRYYERDSFSSWAQKKKQRAEKILLICVVVVCIGFNIAYLVLQLINDKSTKPKVTKVPFIDIKVMRTIANILQRLQIFDKFVTQLLLSLVLLLYFWVLLCQHMFVPVHTFMKVILVYICFKAVPSDAFFQQAHISNTLDYVMWVFACLPFLIVLPIAPYVCTRSPSDVIQEVSSILRSFLQLLLSYLYPSKSYRLMSMLSSILGACAFLLLLFSIIVPWSNIVFRPNADLRAVITEIDEFSKSVSKIIEPFQKVKEKVCGSNTRSAKSELEKAMAKLKEKQDKFDEEGKKSMQESNKNITNLLKSDTFSSGGCEVIDTISCTAYLVAYVAAIALMLVPFAGIAGKVMLTAARVSRKVVVLLKTFIKVIDKIIEMSLRFQQMLTTLLADPIFTWTISFKPAKYMMIFLLPCFLLGLFCFSLGFFRRMKTPSVKIRALISLLSFVFLTLNGAVGVFAWKSKWITETIMNDLPLVEIRVDELRGWRMIKLAYVFSALSSGLLWMYSSADFVISLLKFIFGSLCRILKKCCKKREGKKENKRKGTVRKIVSYTKKEKQKTKEKIKMERYTEEAETADDLASSPTLAGTTNGNDKTDINKSKKKKKKKHSNVVLSRVWVMPLVPALLCGCYLVYGYVKGQPGFIGELGLNGGTIGQLTDVDNMVGYTLDNIGSLQKRDTCDPITGAVEKIFKEILKQLISSAIEKKLGKLLKQIKDAFDIIPKIDLDKLNFAVIILPLMACVLFLVGFCITMIPFIPKIKKTSLLQLIERYIIMCISSSITFYLTTTDSLISLASGIPLMNVRVIDGPLVEKGQLVAFVLILAFMELKISQLVPISR